MNTNPGRLSVTLTVLMSSGTPSRMLGNGSETTVI